MSFRARLAFLLLAATCAPAQDDFQGVRRIVAFGDIHGDYDRFVELLRTAALIDKQNVWTGAASHLVLDGDFVDRGPATRKVLELAMALQEQASKAGGAVHALLGNHEVMDMIGDLRYVSAGDWRSYRSPDSAKNRDREALLALEELKAKGTPPENDKAFLDNFKAKHQLGWVEQRRLFGPEGQYGKWLRLQPAMIRIDDVIFMHAGIPPKYVSSTRAEINRGVLEELDDPAKRADGMITTEDGPLWYRGLLTAPQGQPGLAAHVDAILGTQQARHIVVGHSVLACILPRFGGKVIGIDVGLSSFYKGSPAFLLIEDDRFYVVQRGVRIDFPADGRNEMQYLRDLAKADPGNARIKKLIQVNAH